MRLVEARYEEGLLRPETPLARRPGERVALMVLRHPDPKRWDLDWLAKSGSKEDRVLAEQGLAEWAADLVSASPKGLPETSIALAFQMRAIPKAALQTRIRSLTEAELAELELATDEALGRIEPEGFDR